MPCPCPHLNAMTSGSEIRIPVFFSEAAGDGGGKTGDAWLVEEGMTLPADGYAVGFALPPRKFGEAGGHPGCFCCTPRGPAAEALTRMFRARSMGTAPFFKRVVVLASTAGLAAVREAIAQDVVTKARYVAVN
jgi:hypothetical protein